MRAKILCVGVVLSGLNLSCAGKNTPDLDGLREDVDAMIASGGAEVSVYYGHLGRPDSLMINVDARMHAASTMKVPVMIQLFRDEEAGVLSLDDSIPVTRTFHSIVDGSPFELDDGSDSELALYERVGGLATYRELNELMITVSSNLATNILIDRLDAKRVTTTARSLGADSIEVLRGVEDIPAFEAGLSNSTTARDLGVLLVAMHKRRAAGAASTTEMLGVLTRQRFNEMIPAGLPPGTVVAHKTGNITGISHDAAIVLPDEPGAYVLVILTRGFDNPSDASATISAVARRIHTHTLS